MIMKYRIKETSYEKFIGSTYRIQRRIWWSWYDCYNLGIFLSLKSAKETLEDITQKKTITYHE